MRAAIEMMLMRAMSASAAREESRRRKRNARARERAITCAVCRMYGGTMYKRGNGYICRECRRKEGKKDGKTD
jgi:hypothetical protein